MKPRPVVLQRIFLALSALLVLRLTQLQLVQGARYARLSDRNRIRQVILSAPRGRVFDRNGELLADTRPSFTVSVIPTEMDDNTLASLAGLLEVPEDELRDMVRPVTHVSAPVKVRRNLTARQLYRLEENRFRLAGVRTSVDPVRNYPGRETYCHVLGHVGEANAADLARDTSYRLLDFVGRDGIEGRYEAALRGRDGVEYIEVDVRGQEIGPLAEKRLVEPQAGSDLHLTVDARLHRECERLMRGRAGAAVALDVRTGEVLCLYSQPGYDPGIFTGPIPARLWDSLVGSPGRPFFHRAICAGYPPGSVFKPFVALAALESGRATAGTRYAPCQGSYRYGDRTFACWSRHGSLAMVDALAHSCNVYFYQLGLDLGLDSLASFVGSFPFGRPTGIDVPNEAPGRLPTRDWLDKRYGRNRWGRGTLLNLSIGQGEMLATPLQVALAFAAIAGEGRYHLPHIVARVDSAGVTTLRARPRAGRAAGDAASYRIVKRGLERVVERGTARAARLADVAIAGKTGTAQNPSGEDHAWFACYAPVDNPEIAVAVIVERGGHGGAVAAPIARQLVRRWFDLPDFEPPAEPVRPDSADDAR
ncbi:MAG: penicillin-binding protein 2 [bacterium]